ncbi:HYC_CC_PP family protein [Namhaeicola litoreus]|uniref:Secreted protein n=1 Tax=Namhaeicola litoreus TaxID=1052145 RepID=A0ABW3Y3U5_9FLAO
MKQIIAISLSLIMLSSQLGIAMNTHFCGDIAVKSALTFGEKHLDCGMANMDSACELKDIDHDNITSQTCCKNLHQLLNSDENFKNQVSEAQFSTSFFVAFVHTFINGFSVNQEEKIKFYYEPPPPVAIDIQVLYQTFLI